MGTRSLTIVLDEDNQEICVLYRQMDGYPTGHGADLKDFLKGFSVVNGYGSSTPNKAANGMSCLAAQMIAHFKEGIGGFYLHPSGTRDCGEEYVYTIYLDNTGKKQSKRLKLKIQAGAVTFFGFPGTKQPNMPVIYDGLVRDFNPVLVEADWRNREEEPVNDFLDEQIHSSDIITTD
ncbi:MAG: hypothetical protein ACKVRN_01400 [Pyrinomonadaceae bacterium]